MKTSKNYLTACGSVFMLIAAIALVMSHTSQAVQRTQSATRKDLGTKATQLQSQLPKKGKTYPRLSQSDLREYRNILQEARRASSLTDSQLKQLQKRQLVSYNKVKQAGDAVLADLRMRGNDAQARTIVDCLQDCSTEFDECNKDAGDWTILRMLCAFSAEGCALACIKEAWPE